MPDRRCCGYSRQCWREITLLPSAAFRKWHQFFLPHQKRLEFSSNGKARFSRRFLLLLFIHVSNKGLSVSIRALHYPHCLKRAVPRAPLRLPFPAGLQPNPTLLAWLHAPAIPSCLVSGSGCPLPYPASSSAPQPRGTRGSSQQLPKRAISCRSHTHTFPGPAKASSPLHPLPCASPASSSSSQQMKGTGKFTSSIPWHGDFSQASAFPASPSGTLLDIQTDAGITLIIMGYKHRPYY